MLDIDAVMVAPAYRKQALGDGLVLDEWGSVRTIGHDDYALVVEDRVPIKSEADLARWQAPDPDDPYRYEPIRRAVERFGGRRAIILQMRDVWSGVRDYMGYERALVNMIEAPALVQAVVERCVDHYIRIIQRAADLGVNIVFSGDDIADAAVRSSRRASGRVYSCRSIAAWSPPSTRPGSTTGSTATAISTRFSTASWTRAPTASTRSIPWAGWNCPWSRPGMANGSRSRATSTSWNCWPTARPRRWRRA